MILLGGLANKPLAQSIADILKRKIYFPTSKFADGEYKIQIPVSLTNEIAFIIQPTSKPVNDNIIELLLLCDAAKRSGAKEIVAVLPYYGYSRQDRKDEPRVPISSAVIASALKNSGATRIITLDIHSEQQQGFFDGPWDNLYGSYALVPFIRKLKIKKPVIVSPDKGGVPRANVFAKLLKVDDVAIVFKERDTKVKNESKALYVLGDVKNRELIIVDDMIDTAGTMLNATRMLKQEGASKIYLVATHGLFSGKALENIMDDSIYEVYCTDTVVIDEKILRCKKVKVASVAPLLAEVLKRTLKGEALSEDLIL